MLRMIKIVNFVIFYHNKKNKINKALAEEESTYTKEEMAQGK